MREVVRCCYIRVFKENLFLFDLIIIDGGKGYLVVVSDILENEFGLYILMVGFVKDDKYKIFYLIIGDLLEFVMFERNS